MRFLSLFILCALLPALVFAKDVLEADQTAVRIMVYFTVGRDDAPATNVTVDQFKAHLRELNTGDYNVLALPDIIAAYRQNKPLPDNAVAITFDGGDKSILTNAAPLLKQYGFPYTVFIAPDRADAKSGPYLNWLDIKALQKLGLVSFGLHPQNYQAIGHGSEQEIRQNINNATARFRDEIGYNAQFFAYPFGEYTQTYKRVISTYDFAASFGQHSGVAYRNADFLALPRFTMTEPFAHQGRFKMTANALPLPVRDITPSVSHIETGTPAIGFTVNDDLGEELENLSCFAAGQDKPKLDILGNRIEIRLQHPITQSRFRVNCTLPVKSQNDEKTMRWRWFGVLLTRNVTGQ